MERYSVDWFYETTGRDEPMPYEYDDDYDELEHDEVDCPDCDGYGTYYADGGFCEVPCMCYCHTMTAGDGQGR